MSLSAPRRTVVGRGSRAVVVPMLRGLGGPVVVVRGGSARWADALIADLRADGQPVHVLLGQGEPDLPQLQQALTDLRPEQPAAVVSIGGGSVVDLGKALAALLPARRAPLDHLEVVGKGLPLEAAPMPFVALPTTAGTGAEATRNAVIDVPEHRRKVSLRDIRMLPDLAVLDADLTDGAPWSVTLACGMDALTQLIEPYLCTRATPEVDALCRVAIPAAMEALLRLSKGEDAQARDTLQRAAYFSGLALANSGLGAVHGLAGVIGGQTGAPHGAICARLLPSVLRHNRAECLRAGLPIDRFEEIDRMIALAFGALGGEGDAAELLQRFLTSAPLAPFGEMDDRAVAEAAVSSSSMAANPVKLNDVTLMGIIAEAREIGLS